MSRSKIQTLASIRQWLAFFMLVVCGYLCLATSCDDGQDVEIKTSLPVRLSEGQTQLLLEVEMYGAYVELSSDAPLLFAPPPTPQDDDSAGIGGSGGANVPPTPVAEATMTYCSSVIEEPSSSPSLGECVRLPGGSAKKVRVLVERQGDALSRTVTIQATVHSGLSCSSEAKDATGSPERLSLKVRAID